MTGRFATLILLLWAAPLTAAPIYTNAPRDDGGCVTTLPAEGLRWESTEDFRFAVFWDTEISCGATTANLTYHYLDLRGDFGRRIEVPYAEINRCVHYQVDWAETETSPIFAFVYSPLEALINGDCEGAPATPPAPGVLPPILGPGPGGPPMIPPAVGLPPLPPPGVGLQPLPPPGLLPPIPLPPNEEQPPPAGVPEPATTTLFACGLALLALARRVR